MKANLISKILALALFVGAAGCSNDKTDNSPKAPVFPEMQTIELGNGETFDFTFDADYAWKLTSNQAWCLFADESGEWKDKTGPAGHSTVKVVINDAGHTFDPSATAIITMIMNGNDARVYEITRPGMVRAVKMYKKDGSVYEEIEDIIIEYGVSASGTWDIGFSANFEWKIAELSENFTLNGTELGGTANLLPGDPGAKIAVIGVADRDALDPFVQEGKIVVSDISGNYKFEFPIKYTGMPDDAIDIRLVFTRVTVDRDQNGVAILGEDYDAKDGNKPMGFSENGYLLNRPEATDEVTSKREFIIKPTTKEFKYETFAVYFDDNNNLRKVNEYDDFWLQVEKNADRTTTVSVPAGVDNSGQPMRTAYVFTVPSGLYDTPEFYWGDYFNGPELTDQTYATTVTLAGTAVTAGFKLVWSQTGQPIPFGDMFQKITPGHVTFFDDMIGAPPDNTYMLSFSNNDIPFNEYMDEHGQTQKNYSVLQMAPLGLSFSEPEDPEIPPFYLFQHVSFNTLFGTWPDEVAGGGSVFSYESVQGAEQGVGYDGNGLYAAQLDTQEGAALSYILFYGEESATEAVAALVLMKWSED